MTAEEKMDLILKKLDEKKNRDAWDKFQIIATILTSIFTLLLAGANLWITTQISEQSQTLSKTIHQDEQLVKQREADRQEMDELIQELALLPDMTKLLEDKNPAVRNVARKVLDKLSNNEKFKGHVIIALAHFPKDVEAPSNAGVVYKTNSLTTNEQPFWVYLGQKENGSWQTRFFAIDGLPKPSSIIQTTASVYKRNRKPTKVGEPDQWDLGDKIGVIRPNSTVTVVDTLTLEGNNYWALVK